MPLRHRFVQRLGAEAAADDQHVQGPLRSASARPATHRGDFRAHRIADPFALP
jgi:hypothetical protein